MAYTARTETYFYTDDGSMSYPYNITVDKPSGTAEGDILFCCIAWFSSGKPDIDYVPAGWTLIAHHRGNFEAQSLYYKVAGASEPSDYTWSLDGPAKTRMVCSCYIGGDFDAEDPIDVYSNTEYKVSNTTVRAASMSVSATDSPLVFWAIGYYYDSIATFTKPSSPGTWIEDDDVGDNDSDWSIEVCSQIWSSSGATGDMDATASLSMTLKHGFAVALNPSAGGQHYERSGTALLGLVGVSSRGLALTRSGISSLGLLPTGSRSIALSRGYTTLLGLKATASRTIALTRSKTALLGLLTTASKGLSLSRAKTALLGLTTTGSRTIALTRSKVALLGLKATATRTVAVVRVKTALLGLKATGVMTTAEHYVRTGIAYLGLVATGTRTTSITRVKTALLGLKATGSRTIAITRSGTALLGLKAIGLYSTAKHYIRTGIAYLGLVATGTRSMAMARSKTALLGLKGTGSRTIAITRSGVALLGLKVTGLFDLLGRLIAARRPYTIEVRNADGDLIAILENAHDISYSQVINSPHSLSLKIPSNDSKASNILLANEYWLRDNRTNTVIKKFKLYRKVDSRS